MTKRSKELLASLEKTETPGFKKRLQKMNENGAESVNMVKSDDTVGRIKFYICGALTKIKVEAKLSNEQFSSCLGITPAQGSLITHRKIEKMSLDFLVEVAARSGAQHPSIRFAVERLSLSFA
ncbi:hypothetical protein WDW37_05580 [Bdellovibrionota bacterium FG-1]